MLRTATLENQAGKPGGGGCSNLTGGHQKGPPQTRVSGPVGIWETVLRAEGEAGAKALRSGDLPKAHEAGIRTRPQVSLLPQHREPRDTEPHTLKHRGNCQPPFHPSSVSLGGGGELSISSAFFFRATF